MSKNLLAHDFSKYPFSPEKKFALRAINLFVTLGAGTVPRVARNRIEFILANCPRSTILKRHAKSSADTFLSAYWRQRWYICRAGLLKDVTVPRYYAKLVDYK
jgi:hypothetical protein